MQEFPLDVPDHSGQPVDPHDVFFGDIEAVGKVLSAQTNLNRVSGVKGRLGYRLRWAIALGLAGMIVGGIAAGIADAASESFGTGFELIWLGFVGLGVLIGALLGRPPQICTFVGERGIARVRRKGDRVRQDVLRFEQASELRSKQVRQYVNGVYTGTTFQYDWLDGEGRVLFRSRGQYRQSRRKPVARQNEYHFAQAAGRRWNEVILPGLIERLEKKQTIRFRVGKSRWIDIGPGFMDFGLKNQPVHLEAADIDKMKIRQGILTIKPNNAGLFGSLRVSLAEIGNQQIFLSLLEITYGVRFGS